MKTEYKAVIASVMVLALCLCAVGGVTYSWFSDTEQADVSITAGTIDLTVGDETVYIQSYGGSEKTLTSGTQESTDLGGSVTYTKSTANDSTKFTVVFTNAAPGDSIRIHVGDITLKNTINVKYNETYSVETLTGADPTLETPFKVDGLTSIIDATAQTDADATARKIVDAHDIVISIPTTIGSEYMGASYKVSIEFNAYQSNAPLPSSGGTTTAIVTAGSAVDVKIAASDSSTIEGVGIKVESSANIPAQTLTVSDSAMQSDDAYTLSQSTTVLAGIEVTSSLGGNALEGIPTTITFTLKGDWTNTTLEVYHGTTKFADVNSTQMTYDSTNGVTKIEMTTTAGFSPYFVTTSSVAAIGGTGYNTLEEAVDAAQSGDTIILLKDVTITNGIEISAKTMTLDLNGKVLESTADGIKVDDSSNVTVVDSGNEGKITAGNDGTAGSENLPIYAMNESTLILNGGTFQSKSCAECIFASANSKVFINGGTYMSTVPNDKTKGWLINVSNYGSVSSIIISGGTFVDYDPSTGDDSLGDSFIASGYGVVTEAEGKYTVQKTVEITDLTGVSAGGCFKLMNDVTLEDCLTINAPLYLNLNGNTVTGKIDVKASTTIVSSADTKGKIASGTNDDRAINVGDVIAPITLKIEDVDIVGPTTGTYTRGISAYNNADITIILNNCEISANYYALNIASDNEDCKVYAKNCVITGWCAYQTWSESSFAEFTECKLQGINDKSYNADGWNGFATVVINDDGVTAATNSSIIFNSCELTATQTTGNTQDIISFRVNSTATFNSCTFKVDGSNVTEIPMDVDPNVTATVVIDGTTSTVTGVTEPTE